MKSIKNQLFVTILCIVFLFGIFLCSVMLFQLIGQKNTIQRQGRRSARNLSEETGEALAQINEQIARDFADSCAQYFNMRFAVIRRHVEAVRDNTESLYRAGRVSGGMDARVGLVEGVTAGMVRQEFGMISPIRDFIRYLPEYDRNDLDRLDLYVMTESGMCLDGTGEAAGSHYPDLRQEDWYRRAEKRKKAHKPYWSGVFTGRVTGKQKVICAMPIRDEKGRFRGCAAGDMNEKDFDRMVEEFDEEQIISVIFFDRKGELMHAGGGYRDTGRVKKHLGKDKIVNLGEEIYAYTTLKETGWTICLVLDQEEVLQTERTLQTDVQEDVEGTLDVIRTSIGSTMTFFGAGMAGGALLCMLVAHLLAGGFVRPIRLLMDQVQEIGSGNLDQSISVASKNEIGQLAGAFQRMTTELKAYMEDLRGATARQERMTAELGVARQIQQNMLPQQFPAFPDRREFEIYGTACPAEAGGGSFYDFFLADRTRLCMVMGDVAGTGIPATLFAVITKTLIKNFAQLGYDPDRILAETNNQLSYKNDAGLTVSVFVGIADLQTGRFRYANAGRPAQMWKHAGSGFEVLRAASCFDLGGMENVPYRQQAVSFSQGDMLLLYTQGVPETADRKGNVYTQEYLQEYLNRLVRRQYGIREFAEDIMADLQKFADGRQQERDRTLTVFRYFGK